MANPCCGEMRHHWPIISAEKRNDLLNQIVEMRHHWPIISAEKRNDSLKQIVEMRHHRPIISAEKRNALLKQSVEKITLPRSTEHLRPENNEVSSWRIERSLHQQ